MVRDECIKMCREANELQKAWVQKPGDRFLWDNEIRYYVRQTGLPDYTVHTTDNKGGTFILRMSEWEKERFTGLPYQEQLQELIPKDMWRYALDDIAGSSDPDDLSIAWLQAYMGYVHGLEWNGIMVNWIGIGE